MNDVQLARGLGWFSLGLGAAEIVAAPQLGSFFGIGDKAGTFRKLGAREIATGVATLKSRVPRGPIWARVAGDAIDAAILGSAVSKRRARKGRIAVAIGIVAA